MARAVVSKLFDLEEIDIEDDLDAELSRFFALHREAVGNCSEKELHFYLQAKTSKSEKDYIETVSALLYGILTEQNRARTHFECLSLVNRDGFTVVLSKLHKLARTVKFQRIKGEVKDQMLWLINELTGLVDIKSIYQIYLILLRQIKGGDTSSPNVHFCKELLGLCITHKARLYDIPDMTALTVYTFTRLIADHHREARLSSLKDREVKFVVSLMREKWTSCSIIGRDLIRILLDVVSIPDLAELWEDIMHRPGKLSPNFKSIDMLWQTPTPKKFLECRLTPDMYDKLLHILQNVKISQYERNLGWFVQRFLPPESEPFYVDVIRFIVAGWYPDNQILQSEVVPRYVIIGRMLRSIKSENVVDNVRMALVYDWLFFQQNDNIMLIEPAMLLIERSAERYPFITSSTLRFLKQSIEKYLLFFPYMRELMAQCAVSGMRAMLHLKVIRSLWPIYKCPKTDNGTRQVMKSLFGDFLTEDIVNTSNPPPTVTHDAHHDGMKEEANGGIGKMTSTQQRDMVIDTKEKEHTLSSALEDDEDQYLYGDSQGQVEDSVNAMTSTKEAVNGDDVDMEDTIDPPSIPAMDEKEVAEHLGMKDSEKDMDTTSDEKDVMADNTEAATDCWEEEDDETTGGEQSYWIFGESMSRFKAACRAAREAFIGENDQEFETQVGQAKRSLKAILSVFLLSPSQAEAIVATIAPQIRNMILASQQSHANMQLASKLSEDSIVADGTKDAFDLIMTKYWLLREEDDPAKGEKMLTLIACLALKGRPHVIGMRWWLFIAWILQQQPEKYSAAADNDTLRKLFSHYETMVMYIMNEKQIMSDKSVYFKEYLVGDLQLLAEQNLVLFHTLIPLVYKYQPLASVGNINLLKIVATMMLPDYLGKLVWLMHSGRIRMFGDDIDMAFVVSSVDFDAFETMALWQLLAAELRGNQSKVERFFEKSELISLLQSRLRNESLPSLLVILSSVHPSRRLLESVIQVVCPDQSPHDTTFSFVLSILAAWADTFANQLLKGVSELASDLSSEQDKEEDHDRMRLGRSLVVAWKAFLNEREQMQPTDMVVKDGPLLAKIAHLGVHVGEACPETWPQAPDKTRRKKRTILFDSDESE